MYKTKRNYQGFTGVGIVVVLLVLAVFVTVYMRQDNEDRQLVSAATKEGALEEAHSLMTLDHATHSWLNDRYNRARLHDYDVRYEISQQELIEKGLLPPEFANRYNAIGESVYGLDYVTSVIKRSTTPSIGGAGARSKTYNVLTTIGIRGDFPPNDPIACPYLVVVDGVIQTHVVTIDEDTIPSIDSCADMPVSWHRNNLKSHWANLNHSFAFGFDDYGFSCSIVNSPPSQAVLDAISPFTATSFFRCAGTTPTPNCEVFFTHNQGGVALYNTKVYEMNSSCASPLIPIARTRLRMFDQTNQVVNGVDFGTLSFSATEPDCTVTSSTRMDCVSGSSTPPPQVSCPVYFYWTVNSVPSPVGNPFANTNPIYTFSSACSSSRVTLAASMLETNSSGLSRPTNIVTSDWGDLRCVLGAGGNSIFCNLNEGASPQVSCPVYFRWTVGGVGKPDANPFTLSDMIKEYQQNCSIPLTSTASSDIFNDNSLLRSTSMVDFNGTAPTCSLDGGGSRINCLLDQTDPGNAGNVRCDVYWHYHDNPTTEYQAYYLNRNCNQLHNGADHTQLIDPEDVTND